MAFLRREIGRKAPRKVGLACPGGHVLRVVRLNREAFRGMLCFAHFIDGTISLVNSLRLDVVHEARFSCDDTILPTSAQHPVTRSRGSSDGSA